jgi:putative FmdB family regulatory protein
MPLYEYQCGKCNHRFEKIQKFSDPAPDACPVCGSGPVTRLPSSPAIQFKGTGWYITDYARKSGGEKSKDGGSGKDASTGTESGAPKDGGASKDGGKDKGTSDKGTSDKGTSTSSSSAPSKSETSSTPTKTAKSGSG